MIDKRPKLKTIEEVEIAMANDFRVVEEIGNEPWCWINTKGKIIPCDFEAHDLKIMELFTDELNPEMGDYILDSDVTGMNRDHYIEKHWVRISAQIISIPLKFTARQKLAIEKIVSKFPDYYFTEQRPYFRCFPMNAGLPNSKDYVLVLENKKVKWDIS